MFSHYVQSVMCSCPRVVLMMNTLGLHQESVHLASTQVLRPSVHGTRSGISTNLGVRSGQGFRGQPGAVGSDLGNQVSSVKYQMCATTRSVTSMQTGNLDPQTSNSRSHCTRSHTLCWTVI